VWHLVFNVMALVPLFNQLEHALCTLKTAYVVVVVWSLLTSLLYLMASGVLVVLRLQETIPTVLGSSGLYLSCLVYYVKHLVDPKQRHLVLLVAMVSILITLFMPNTSLLGHLCALAVGYLYAFDYLGGWIPSDDTFTNVENAWMMHRMRDINCYKGTSSVVLPIHSKLFPGKGRKLAE
jgi:glycosylphosphatidylinositol transamidase